MTFRSKRPPARQEWQQLGKNKQAAIIALGAVQVSLLATAQANLLPMDKEDVRGPKWLWFLVNFVNFVGPILFLTFGRRGSRR